MVSPILLYWLAPFMSFSMNGHNFTVPGAPICPLDICTVLFVYGFSLLDAKWNTHQGGQALQLGCSYSLLAWVFAFLMCLLVHSVRSKENKVFCLFSPLHLGANDDRICNTQRHLSLDVGGTTPDTHGRAHGLRPQGRPSPQDEALRGTTLLGASRKTPGRYPEDTTRSVRICMISRFL